MHAQRREQRGVLAAGDAAAEDGERARHAVEQQDRVGVVDVGVVDRVLRRVEGPGAGGEQDHVGAELLRPAVGDRHPDGVRVDEARDPAELVHAGAVQRVADAGVLAGGDQAAAAHELGDRDRAGHVELDAVGVAARAPA